MKFGRFLKESVNPRFGAENYVDYKSLKNIIKEFVMHQREVEGQGINLTSINAETGRVESFASDMPLLASPETPLPSTPYTHPYPQTPVEQGDENAEFREEFKVLLVEELRKVNAFRMDEMNRLNDHFLRLKRKVEKVMGKGNVPQRTVEGLKLSCTDHYREIKGLLVFISVNHLAFYKITKKFCKATGARPFTRFLNGLADQPFHQKDDVEVQMEEVEHMYSKIFTDGNKVRAHKELNRLISQHSSTDLLLLGIAYGFAAGMIFVLIGVASFGEPIEGFDDDVFLATFPVFRAVLVPIVMMWLFGFNVYVWRRNHINYAFIMDLHAHNLVSYLHLWKVAGILFDVWISCYMMFLAHIKYGFRVFDLDHRVYPALMVVTMLVLLLWPRGHFYFHTRKRLLTTVIEVVRAPFGPVKFRQFFVGDILTSSVRTIFDWVYTACFYASGSFLMESDDRCKAVQNHLLVVFSVLPLFFRMAQCLKMYYATGHKFPHLANAMKYFTGSSVVFFGALNSNFVDHPYSNSNTHRAWIACSVISTMYMLVWDITMDWGLFRVGWKGGNKLLRPTLLYSYKWTYYYAILSDAFLRYVWTLTVTPEASNHIGFSLSHFPLTLALLETFRRFQWAIFRLENEEVSNPGEYRTVNIIPPDLRD